MAFCHISKGIISPAIRSWLEQTAVANGLSARDCLLENLRPERLDGFRSGDWVVGLAFLSIETLAALQRRGVRCFNVEVTRTPRDRLLSAAEDTVARYIAWGIRLVEYRAFAVIDGELQLGEAVPTPVATAPAFDYQQLLRRYIRLVDRGEQTDGTINLTIAELAELTRLSDLDPATLTVLSHR